MEPHRSLFVVHQSIFHFRSLSLIFFILFLFSPLFAKTPDDYFHKASSHYVNGRQQQALIEAEEGLGKFPQDDKLIRLAAHLKKLEDQKKEENQQNQQNQDPSQEDKEKEKQEQEPKDKEKEENQEQKPDSSSAENQPEEEQPPDSAQAQPPPGEMSEEDAKRLLDSYQQDDKRDLDKGQKRKGRPGSSGQDW